MTAWDAVIGGKPMASAGRSDATGRGTSHSGSSEAQRGKRGSPGFEFAPVRGYTSLNPNPGSCVLVFMTRRTKIVATLGPASSDAKTLERMIAAGLDVVRMNFSHGTAKEHADRVNWCGHLRARPAIRWECWSICKGRRSASALQGRARLPS